MKYYLECLGCGTTYKHTYRFQTCSKCAKNLEVIYTEKSKRIKAESGDVWDYEFFLPADTYKHYVLGGTKLIKSRKHDNLYLKLEVENPTGSFKDRGSVVEIMKAKEYGYNEITCASTGNMAYSLSYYSNLEGFDARVFISNDANRNKVKEIKEIGNAKVVNVNGDFNKAMDLAYRYSKKNNAFLTGDYCYRKEGQKTLMYEIMDQMPSLTHLIIPVGNATLLSGVWKALKEMRQCGMIKRFPKMVAVQAERCDPLVRAFKARTELKYVKPRTKADAIAVGYPTFGYQGLDAIRETGGTAITISEEEMHEQQKRFHDNYGLVAELAGVAPIVAYKKLNLRQGDKVVAIVSGGNV